MAWLKTEDYDYRHVAVSGRFLYADTALVFTPAGPQDMGPGYLFLTPLQLASGAYVIVNRGFVPAELARQIRKRAEPESEVHVVGLMRPPQKRELFTPPDDPEKGEYFTRDPALMVAHYDLAPVAPFLIDADAYRPGRNRLAARRDDRARPPQQSLELRVYWFGLAAGLFGVFAGFFIRKIKENRSP